MAEIRVLINQIRFSLDNLGAQNRHHDFESICRHFSRQRLGLNILPATGPVSSGGDQGRDFETYYISPAVLSKIDVKIIRENAAFACTTQKNKLCQKIEDDIKKIIKSGNNVDIIYIYSLQNVAVSHRHKIQDWAKDTYSIKVEIFDGEYLAEALSEKDLFWIAIEYLQIPSNLYPVSEDIDYKETKKRWENASIDAPNYAVFDELRNLGRRCLFDKETQRDLLFWLSKLDQLLIFDSSQVFKRKVLYEIIALRIRGTGNLLGWEKYARQYFNLSISFNNQVEAQEACVITNYAYGSMIRKVSEFTNEEIIEWRKLIEKYADNELKKEYPKTIRAVIYELKGYLVLSNPYNRNIDEGLNWWLKLATLIKDTPLFPLERFSDVLVAMIEYIGNNPKYEQLSQKIDVLLGKRVGGFAVAEKCRDRSMAYREKGELIKSLKELYKAMVGWYAHETLYGSLLSMLLIAETYKELGLIYAAKQYALAVIYVSHRAREDKEKIFIMRGLASLAEYEYADGEWAHFLEHADLSLRALSLYTKGLADSNSEKIYEKMSFYTSLVSAFTSILDKKAVYQYVENRISKFKSEIIEELIPAAKESWSKKKTEDVLNTIQSGFKNYPFNDVGQERTAKFSAFGVTWRFYWKNGLIETAKAEQLISLIQILLAESIEEELYLLKCSAKIEIKFGEAFKNSKNHEKDIFSWIVTFPLRAPADKSEIELFNRETLGIAIQILSELSLLPIERLRVLLETLFKEGLASKTFAANSYEMLFMDNVPRELYDYIIGLEKIGYLENLEYIGDTHPLLKWKDSIISEATEKQSEELIKNRYEKARLPIYMTVQRLREYPIFREITKKLKMEGWKDWHILMALALIATNYRTKKNGFQNADEMKDNFMKYMSSKETSQSIPIPLDEFSEIKIREHLFMSMPSTLKLLGLEYRSTTYAPSAIKEFLEKRCRYFADDVPHEEIFYSQ